MSLPNDRLSRTVRQRNSDKREDDMSGTVAFLYDDHEDARQAVRDLEARVPHDDITIIANDRDDRHRKSAKAADVGSGAGTGAGIGAVVGGGAGLLAGLGVLAIPGIGPVVAAGWLAATLAGAAAGAGVGAVSGGIIEAMTSAGVAHEDAHLYAEGIRRGGTLVMVRVKDDSQADIAAAIMRQHRPVDTTARGMAWRQEGWKAFDPSAAPYGAIDADLPRRTRAQ
jgi:hypothetical protein